jgi:hypothetical protein
VVVLLLLAVIPGLLNAASWLVGALFGSRELARFFAASADRVVPTAATALLLSAGTGALCMVGALVAKRWRFLSWALPLVPAVCVGGWTAFMSRGGEIPGALVATAGLTAAGLTFLVIGTYWYILTRAPNGQRDG